MAKKREEFEDRLKWNVKDLYPSVEAFTKDYEFLEKKIIEFAKYKNHILDSADTLYELLSFDNEFNKKLEQVYIYAHIQNDHPQTPPEPYTDTPVPHRPGLPVSDFLSNPSS